MNSSKLQRISDRILYLPAVQDTDRPVLAAISGTERTLLMDAGNSSAHAALFLQALEAYDLPKADLLMITHWHWDHIVGMKEMNLPAIAHFETRNKIAEMLDWEWSDEALDGRVALGIEIPFVAEMIKKEFPDARNIDINLPTLLFKEEIEVDLGGVTCLIQHVGGDHSQDSCVVYVKEDKTLFLGDCLYQRLYSPKWYYTSKELLPLLSKIESYDAEIYVPSHGEPVTKSQMEKEMSKMRSLASLTHACGGDKGSIVSSLSKELGTDLTSDDQDLIDWFINGYNAC